MPASLLTALYAWPQVKNPFCLFRTCRSSRWSERGISSSVKVERTGERSTFWVLPRWGQFFQEFIFWAPVTGFLKKIGTRWKMWIHRINLKGCVDRGFYYYGTLKSTFRIQTHSEIDTSTTSGHPLSFLFNEPLEFHWIRQWKLKFKVRTAQHCPTSPFCHIEICLHSAWQCVHVFHLGFSFTF